MMSKLSATSTLNVDSLWQNVQNTCDAGDSLSSVMLMAVGMWLKQLLSASPVSEVLGVLARPVMV